MTEELKGQVAFVTGGGRGFGRAMALGLATVGAKVTVTARSKSEIEGTVAAVEAAGGQALALPLDVTSRAQIDRAVYQTERKFGPIDLLVNNAAVTEPVGPIWEIDPDVWQQTIETNLVGPVRMARAVMPGMVQRGHGRIINVSSGAGVRAGPYDSAYRVSKTGLIRLTEIMAIEAKEHGIGIFTFHPGVESTSAHHSATMTEAGRRWLPQFGEMAERGKTGFEHAVRACIFIASGAADGLSGRYFSATEDFEALAGRTPEIQEQDLQVLKLAVAPKHE